MRASFSTDDVPAKERHEYWRHLHRAAFALDIRFPDDWQDRPSHCAVSDLGAVTAATISIADRPHADPGEIRRPPRLCDQMEAYEIKFSIASERFVLSQDGRDADLRPGDFAIADTTRPSAAMASGSHAKRLASVLVPRTLLPLPPAQVARITAVRMSGLDGAGALVSAVLRHVAADAATYQPAEAARISSAVLDLVAAAIAGRLERATAVSPESERNALRHRVYAYMSRNLADPALTPRAIADAHFVSLRQLYKLFEGEEQSIAQWIQGQRLDRCRRDLSDPALSGRPAAAIAACWGFRDPAHFSRAFSAHYGMPPGEYRRQLASPR